MGSAYGGGSYGTMKKENLTAEYVRSILDYDPNLDIRAFIGIKEPKNGELQCLSTINLFIWDCF